VVRNRKKSAVERDMRRRMFIEALAFVLAVPAGVCFVIMMLCM